MFRWEPRALRAQRTLRELHGGCGLAGGALIGQGEQGAAFVPPLHCAPGSGDGVAHLSGRASPLTKRPAVYVGKVTSGPVAAVEADISRDFVAAVDPYARFTAPVVTKCALGPAQDDPDYLAHAAEYKAKGWDTLVFSRYRGKSVMQLWEVAEAGMMSLPLALRILGALAVLVGDVITYVNGKAGVLHADAHAGNVVFDADTNIAALIDFGFARPLADVMGPAAAEALKEGRYDAVPATRDVRRIVDETIAQFFSFGRDSISSQLLAIDGLARWFEAAKELRRQADATQADYLASAQELQRQVVRAELDMRAADRALTASLLRRISWGGE